MGRVTEKKLRLLTEERTSIPPDLPNSIRWGSATVPYWRGFVPALTLPTGQFEGIRSET
jgi:hypothetical protein